MKRYSPFLVLCVLATAVELSAAPIVYEQLAGSALSAVGWNGSQWIRQAQTFTLAEPAYISMAEVNFFITSTEIYTCRLTESDLETTLAQTTGFVPSPDLTEWERFVFGSGPLLAAGDYAITLQASEVSSGDIDAIYRAGSGNPFPDGAQAYSIAGGPWTFSPDTDSLFRFTFTPVPEPGTAALVLVGSCVLAFSRWSRRRKT